ncbi:MAG: hypothetical protein IJG48_01635 [Mogibacterium sp.]|nr:hypothetical protein [Mogibacterium sp.]
MLFKRLISVVLSLIIAFSFIPATAFADDSSVIRTREDLIKINDNLSGSYVLANDIDLGGENFVSIGTADTPFTGELDGAGHSITNFTYNTPGSNTAPVEVAMFAATDGATIHDLIMSNVDIDVTALKNKNNAYVGVLSLKDTSSAFYNIEISGTIEAKSDDVAVGGLVCDAEGIAVDNINNDIDMTLTASSLINKAGGILATAGGCTITNCSMKGTIRDEESHVRAGGIVGSMSAKVKEKTEIINCVNYADITAHYCGGIIGGCASLGELNVEQCANTGSLTGAKAKLIEGEVAGIVATSVCDPDNTIINCVNEGALTGDGCDIYGIGYAGSISGCKNNGTLSGENVKGIGTGVQGISDCTNYAAITGSDEAYGIGIGKDFTDCINYGDVTQADRSRTTGTASGICLDALNIIRCFNYGKIEGNTACGIAKSTTDELSECFNSGCVTAVKDASGIAINNTDLIVNSYNNGCITGENAAGIVVDNALEGVVINCYNVGAIDGSKLSAGIAVNNKKEVLDSYYFEGTAKGVANNETDAKDTTVSLTNPMLTEQSSYGKFDFVDRSGPWVMSSLSGMPKLACMSDEEDVYIADAVISSYPKTMIANKSFAKGAVKIDATYSNNKTATVKSGYKYDAYKKTVGKRTITLNFPGKTLSFECTFKPAKVGKITLTTKGKSITVKIPKTAGAKKYQIYRSTKKSSGFKLITTTSKTKFTDKKKIKSKKKYYYKVRAVNGSYKGAFSNVYSIKTK